MDANERARWQSSNPPAIKVVVNGATSLDVELLDPITNKPLPLMNHVKGMSFKLGDIDGHSTGQPNTLTLELVRVPIEINGVLPTLAIVPTKED
jgi:hypothetical protein